MAAWMAAVPVDVWIVGGIYLSLIVSCGIVGWVSHRSPQQTTHGVRRQVGR